MTDIITPDLHTIRQGRHYTLTTDGACPGNPGRGGWGYIKQLKTGEQLLRQGASAGRSKSSQATNNQMELVAVIKAIGSVMETETPIIIRTDSNYVLDNFQRWLPGWKAKGWKASDGKPVKNIDL